MKLITTPTQWLHSSMNTYRMLVGLDSYRSAVAIIYRHSKIMCKCLMSNSCLPVNAKQCSGKIHRSIKEQTLIVRRDFLADSKKLNKSNFNLPEHYYDSIDTKDQHLMLKPRSFDRYITEQQKNREDFTVEGKIHITIVCQSCCKETSRFIGADPYSDGTVIVRCQKCSNLCIIADHLSILNKSRRLSVSLQSACDTYSVNRFDKDTIEIVASQKAGAINAEIQPRKCLENGLKPYDGDDSISQCLEEHYTHSSITLGVADDSNGTLQCNKQIADMLLYEYKMMKFMDYNAPDRVSEFHWLKLANMTSTGRRKHYVYLRATEHKVENDKESKAERLQLREERRCKREAGPMHDNTIFIPQTLQYHRRNIERQQAAEGYQFGTDIIYDLGYERGMSDREVKACTHHLRRAWTWNCGQPGGTARVLCTNVDPSGRMYREMCNAFLTPHGHTFIDVTQLHALQLYPRDRLVLLSPDAREYLPDEHDHRSIYIINCIVDLGDNIPMSLASAKQHRITTRALPLDRHLVWKKGRKHLSIEHCHRILLTWMQTNSWAEAFRQHIPRHNVVSESEPPASQRVWSES